MTLRKILRKDGIQGFYRLLRVVWVCGKPGDDLGYSAKLSLALAPRLFAYNRDAATDWCVTLLGIRVHYARSYGGTFAA